jgi:hypothetical protein
MRLRSTSRYSRCVPAHRDSPCIFGQLGPKCLLSSLEDRPCCALRFKVRHGDGLCALRIWLLATRCDHNHEKTFLIPLPDALVVNITVVNPSGGIICLLQGLEVACLNISLSPPINRLLTLVDEPLFIPSICLSEFRQRFQELNVNYQAGCLLSKSSRLIVGRNQGQNTKSGESSNNRTFRDIVCEMIALLTTHRRVIRIRDIGISASTCTCT